MITLNNIEKFYENRVVKTYVLRRINLNVDEGEFVSVMGPSGSGKTTLLNIIGMLDPPSGGEYFFFDEPVHTMSEKKLTELHKTYIGFVFQSYHLIDELTVYENLETPLLYQKVILADEPTGNLHSEQGKEVMDLLKELNKQGTTIIQVTHSETNAAYGNRVIKLEDGWIEK
jgi:ABC-type lipoprotein export system ATPase subunit